MSRTLIQRLLMALVALAAALVVVRVAIFPRSARAKGPEMKTAQVERGDVVSSVTASGTIEALTTVDVKSNVGGRVDVLAVDVGDRVKKGQLIARIDPTDTNTQFAQAQADYQADEARLNQAQINLQLQQEQTQAAITQAEQQFASARAKELQARLQMKTQPALSQAAIRQAQANRQAAQDELNQLQVATIPQAKAEAEAGYQKALADRENARKDYDRQTALLAKGYVAASVVDSAKQVLANAEASLSMAQAKRDTVDQEYAAAVQSARAKVDQARAALDTARSGQMEDDVKTQDWRAAQAAVEQAEAALQLARDNARQNDVKAKEITAARSQSVRSRAALTQARTQLGYTTILAPRDGVVLQKYIEQGTIIASGRSSVVQGTDIVQLGDISRLFITCKVDETDIASVAEGQSVDISVDAYPNELFEGKVVRIDPQATVDQNVTTIPVKVEILDPDARLKPAMNADCEFITAKRENVLVVPNQALRENEGSYEVTVLQGGKPVVRPVEVGVAGPDTTEVRGGLKEGETIVTEIVREPEPSAAPAPNSPFNPLQRFGGGGGGRRGGR
jgi:HlyD family secretion protein